MKRNFTYIDDIIEGVVRVIDKTPTPHKNEYSTSKPPYRIYNIGSINPVTLRDFITAIEDACEDKAEENLLLMQDGDVPLNFADIDALAELCKFKPQTPIENRLRKFFNWYKCQYIKKS